MLEYVIGMVSYFGESVKLSVIIYGMGGVRVFLFLGVFLCFVGVFDKGSYEVRWGKCFYPVGL